MRKVIRFFKRLFGRAERKLEHILADFETTIDDLGRHVDYHVAEADKHLIAKLQAENSQVTALEAASKADAIRLKMKNLIS